MGGTMARLLSPKPSTRTSRDHPRMEAAAREHASLRAVEQRTTAINRRLRELTILSRLRRDYPAVYAACDPANDQED